MPEPNIWPIKSWFAEQYPLHACPQCQLEHVRIPSIMKDGAVLVPFELVQVVEGTARPGGNVPAYNTPAHVYGLFWGIPGDQPHLRDIVYGN